LNIFLLGTITFFTFILKKLIKLSNLIDFPSLKEIK